LSDTLGSIFRAAGLGYFETSGSGSRVEEDGRRVPIDASFAVGMKGDPRRAVELIREALWWVGAPGDTELNDFPFALNQAPDMAASRLLQLAALTVTRWRFGGQAGHRIDRVPFSAAQRKMIRRVLAEYGVPATAEGWADTATADGGRLAVYTK